MLQMMMWSKIHVHTNDPGLAIQKALTYGQLSKMKIDNMREEHQEKLIRDAEKLAEQAKEEGRDTKRKKQEERETDGIYRSFHRSRYE